MSDQAVELLKSIGEHCAKGYGVGRPSPLDLMFMNLARLYRQMPDAERRVVREAVGEGSLRLMLGFSSRMAILAERGQDPELLMLAAVVHSIEDFRWDSRESIIHLALIEHVAKRLEVDSRQLFAEVASLSSAEAARQLIAFSERDPRTKTIEKMGWLEARTEEGVLYRGRG